MKKNSEAAATSGTSEGKKNTVRSTAEKRVERWTASAKASASTRVGASTPSGIDEVVERGLTEGGIGQHAGVVAEPDEGGGRAGAVRLVVE